MMVSRLGIVFNLNRIGVLYLAFGDQKYSTRKFPPVNLIVFVGVLPWLIPEIIVFALEIIEKVPK